MSADRPLSQLQVWVLQVLSAERGRALSPNGIGESVAARYPWNPRRAVSHRGQVPGLGSRLPAPLRGLVQRGLVQYATRPDGRSGTAYRITSAGVECLRSRGLR